MSEIGEPLNFEPLPLTPLATLYRVKLAFIAFGRILSYSICWAAGPKIAAYDQLTTWFHQRKLRLIALSNISRGACRSHTRCEAQQCAVGAEANGAASERSQSFHQPQKTPYDNPMPVALASLSHSLVDFTKELVRVPSRSGIDSYAPVLGLIQRWLGSHGIRTEILCLPNGEQIALMANIGSPARGPTYLLNAPADTADFGDESAWSCDPLAGIVRDGWLFGRGSADCKAGVSIFCHIAAALKPAADQLRGSVTLIFDAEEHTGTFLGIRRFFESHAKNREIRAGFIGYPGQDRIIIGCRGFYRATIRVHGESAHSGSSRSRGVNAITRAMRLVETLQRTEFPARTSDQFPLPPQITVTQISGGNGFSGVPDLCAMNVDIRLTPSFGAAQARQLLAEAAQRLDFETVCARPTEIESFEGFEAYVLDPDSPVVSALRASAQRLLGHAVPSAIAGPSSTGNYLASLGIPATSGFGVACRNLHAADECMAIDSILPAYQVYWGALEELLGTIDAAAS